MRKMCLFVTVLVFAGILCIPQAALAQKIGYVNLGMIFDEYAKTKDQDKVLEKKQNDFETERDAKVKELKGLQDKLALVDEKQKAVKKSELEAKMKAFQDDETKKVTALKNERDDILKAILKDIEKAVKQCAEADGYTLILNDRVLVYQAKEGDLTDKVIAAVNKGYQVPGAAAAK